MASPYPFSTGDSLSSAAVPAQACDCHLHVYDPRFPAVPGARLRPPEASLQDYRKVQQRMGCRRAVVVTPSTYGTDNRPMLQALDALGADGRGVAVIDGQTSDEDLRQMHARGVRGVRINLSQGVTHDAHAIEPLAQRIAPLGWHLQLLTSVDQLLLLAPLLRRLPVDLVLDHFARVAPAQRGRHPAHALVLALLRSRRVWVKLSGGYLVSPLGSVEDPALDALAESYLDTAPDRVVWGSDWPHATASAGHHAMPDDARQIDRLSQWAGDPRRLQQILVTNPAQLYDFSSAETLT